MPPEAHGTVPADADIGIGNWDSDTRTFDPVGNPQNAVQVTVRRGQANGNPVALLFAQVLGFTDLDLATAATAAIGDDSVSCIHAFNATAQRALWLTGKGSVVTEDCTVQVDSSHGSRALSVAHNATLQVNGSAEICLAGGWDIDGTVNPSPSSCDALGDPMPGFSAPGYSTICTYNNVSISGGSQTLYPGYYCGGISISGNADVTFDDGVYILDGPFNASGNGAAQAPPCTNLIADTIKFSGNGSLTYDSDYESSSVPLPAGLGSGGAHLVG